MVALVIRTVVIVVVLGGMDWANAWAGFDANNAIWQRKDYALALREWRPLAEKGDSVAQIRIGTMYFNGYGVPKDYSEAARWYRRAAEQGSAEAMFWLGLMYNHGQGLPQDYAQAHMLFNLAAAYARSDSDRRFVEFFRENIEKEMTAGQIAEAQRLARQWQPKQRDRHASGAISGKEPPRPPKKAATGSGFVVSVQGHILTNEHVVADCHDVRVSGAGSTERMATDKKLDLALLKVSPSKRDAATFRGGRGVRMGEDVIVAGYPLQGLLSSAMTVTKGTVSNLVGPGEDRSIMQITAPVQPGNSGGPVLDASGNVVGVVMAKLDAIKIAQATGTLPENVNFAISEGAARAFLDGHDVPYETARSNESVPTADVAVRAKTFTVLIECWKFQRAVNRLPSTDSSEPAGTGLGLRNVSWKVVSRGGPQFLIVQGEVANVSKDVRKVPRIQGVLFDKDDTELQRWTFSAPESRLLPGENVTFKTEFENPADGATRLTIVFADYY